MPKERAYHLGERELEKLEDLVEGCILHALRQYLDEASIDLGGDLSGGNIEIMLPDPLTHFMYKASLKELVKREIGCRRMVGEEFGGGSMRAVEIAELKSLKACLDECARLLQRHIDNPSLPAPKWRTVTLKRM